MCASSHLACRAGKTQYLSSDRTPNLRGEDVIAVIEAEHLGYRAKQKAVFLPAIYSNVATDAVGIRTDVLQAVSEVAQQNNGTLFRQCKIAPAEWRRFE